MRKMRNQVWSLGIVVVVLAFATLSAEASVVFEEHFDYADQDALDASEWNQVDGSSLSLGDADDSTIPPDPNFGILKNSLSYHDLGTTLTDDWTVSFKVHHTSYLRGTWVGLMDADGQQGYGAHWDSAKEDVASGTGWAKILKFDRETPLDDWSENGDVLDQVESGHSVAEDSMAAFEFSWDKDTGDLTVTVDGDERVAVSDTSFTSFSRIYVKGNSSQYYDDIVVVPEPATLAIVGLGSGIGLLVRRRRR